MVDTQEFVESRDELLHWIEASMEQLGVKINEGASTAQERIREGIDEHKAFQEQIHRRSSTFETTCLRGKALEDHAPPNEKKTKRNEVETLKQRWDELKKLSAKRYVLLFEFLLYSHCDNLDFNKLEIQ